MPPVLLRPLKSADVETLVGWHADDVFRAHAGWSARSSTSLAAFWAEQITRPPEDLLRRAATVDGALIGYVDLSGAGDDEPELGFVVGPSNRWGCGLGTALARAGLELAFVELGRDSVWAEAIAANLASVRILRTVGMRETGWGSEEEFLGRPSRHQQFRLSRDDWIERRPLVSA